MKKLFSNDYFSARQRFLSACEVQALALESIIHPTCCDLRGELAIDIARIGASNASKVLFITSGVHGTEGATGSAVQLGLIEQFARELPQTDIAIVLIHAVNPVGFAKLTRTNEDNIDLNRNFKDFDKALPENPDYIALHDALCSSQWRGEQRKKDDRHIEQYVNQYGSEALTQKVLAGQHSHPDGLFFGGFQPAWSNGVVRDAIQRYAASCESVGIIDIHTGVGPKGVGLILRDEPSVVKHDELSLIDGQMYSVLDDLTQPSKKIKIILEFGTLEFSEVLTALRDDNWLSRNADAEETICHVIKDQLRNALLIDEDSWYQAVLNQSQRLVENIIEELC